MQTQTVAVILDIENLLFGSSHDKEVKFHVRDLTKKIADFICQTSETFGPIAHKYSVISMMPKNGNHKTWQKREDTCTIVKALTGKGFVVTVVPKGEDAADKVLYAFGASLKNDANISTFVIGSGDGRGPIFSLINELKESGKTVHVVAYDSKPAAVRRVETNSAKVTVSIIAPHLHNTIPDSPGEPNHAKIYQKAMHFLNGEKNAKPPSQEQKELIFDAIRVIRTSVSQARYKQFSLGFLIETMKKDFMMIHPETSLEEARAIVTALTKSTDMFEKPPMYCVNNNSNFIEKIKEEIK